MLDSRLNEPPRPDPASPSLGLDGTSAAHPPLAYRGRWAGLRSASRQDYPTLYSWRTDLTSMFLWQPQRRIESYDEFVESTDRLLRTTVTLLVISLPEEAPAGFVQLYDVNLQNGWAYFLSFLDEPWRARPLAAEASMALLDYAFSHFNLRKVYADVYGFNEPVREMLLARGFTEEGRLARHIFWNGKFWGLHQLALYRETWDEYRRDLRLRLVVQADFEDIESSDT